MNNLTVRKFNFTDRNRINREMINIKLKNENSPNFTFDIKLGLDSLNVPYDSEVYLEVYYQTQKKRFSMGIAGNITIPEERSLKEFASFNGINFRLLVVSNSKSRKILAVADRLTPDKETGPKGTSGRKPILPVELDDDIYEVWKIKHGEGNPVLLLNSRIYNIKGRLQDDPYMRLSVLPSALRDILNRIIYVEGLIVEDDDSPYSDWLSFCRMLMGSEQDLPILDVEDENFERNAADEWIDKVVNNFCRNAELLDYVIKEQMR